MCIFKNNSHISFCVHIGFSMNPLLQEFDILEIEPYENRQICTGDIIYFQLPKKYELPGRSSDIVHRIIKINSKGIYTKGDNSKNKDPWVLNHDNIYGRVTGVLRSDRHRKIPGAWMGKIQGFILRQYCVWVFIVSKILSTSYHFLAECDIFKRLLPPALCPGIVMFHAKDKKHVYIMMGRKIIGRYDTNLKRWIIRKPFRLFVNEKSLSPECRSRENAKA